MNCYMGNIQAESVVVLLFSVGVLAMNVPELNWFKAQKKCEGRGGLTSKTTGVSGQEYWTGHYIRLSSWIKIIGCYPDSKITFHDKEADIEMDTKSVGACQEICENKKSSTFALKLNRCTCLKGQVDFDSMFEYSPSRCNYSCDSLDGIYSGECGGDTAYNVFTFDQDDSPEKDTNCMSLQCSSGDQKYIHQKCSATLDNICQNPNGSKEGEAKEWRASMQSCKDSDFPSYLYGNLDLTKANRSCHTLPLGRIQIKWIGIARQRYKKEDQGDKISKDEEKYILLCQRCRMEGNCKFTNCTDTIKNTPECSKGITTESAITNISSTSSTSLHQSLITDEVVASSSLPYSTNEKETITLKQSTATSISTTDESLITSREQQISIETYLSTESITLQLNSSSIVRKNNGNAIISVPIILGVFAAVIIALTVIYIRRRNLRRKMDENKNMPKVDGISNGTYPEVSNQHGDSYFVIEKPSSYELADDSVIDSESLYNETKEGDYDHLRNKDSRKKNVDDTYQHATPVTNGDISNYDSTTVFQKQNQKNMDRITNKSKHENRPALERVNSTYSEVDDPAQSAYFVLEKPSTYEVVDNSVIHLESPYNETEEGDYDHLRNKDSRKKAVDDTYEHASFDSNRDISDYDTSTTDQTQDIENTYDHMHESLILQRESDYGYNSINRKHTINEAIKFP